MHWNRNRAARALPRATPNSSGGSTAVQGGAAGPGPSAAVISAADEFALRTRELDIKQGELDLNKATAKKYQFTGSVALALLAGGIGGYFALEQVRKTAEANLELARQTARANGDLELQKWRRATHDEQLKNASAAMSEYSRQSLRAIQECSALVTHAILEPERFDRTDIARFGKSMREAVPAAVNALYQVGSYAPEAHDQMLPTLTELVTLYGDVEITSVEHVKNAKGGRKDFVALRERASAAGDSLRQAALSASSKAQLEIRKATLLVTIRGPGYGDPGGGQSQIPVGLGMNAPTPKPPAPKDRWLYLPPLPSPANPK